MHITLEGRIEVLCEFEFLLDLLCVNVLISKQSTVTNVQMNCTI